jgi:hypothetical protein
MNKQLILTALCLASLFAATAAHARIGININLPLFSPSGYVPPVVYQPAPYYQPPPVVYGGGGYWGGDPRHGANHRRGGRAQPHGRQGGSDKHR